MLTAFIVSLAVLVTSFIVAAVNMALMAKGALNLDAEGFSAGFAIHLGAMVGSFLGSIGSVVFGIILLVQKFSH